MYKIYKIVDNTNGNVYIGQTSQKSLPNRISNHRYAYKNNCKYLCSSSIILKNNDWFYELIEETDDISREAYWIKNTPNCINKITFYEPIHRKNYLKNWKQNNKLQTNFHQQKRRHYKKTWGGDERYHNNLLNIDVNLFN